VEDTKAYRRFPHFPHSPHWDKERAERREKVHHNKLKSSFFSLLLTLSVPAPRRVLICLAYFHLIIPIPNSRD
jgi:hypothetical protein